VKLRLRRSEPHKSPQAVADVYYASDVHGSDVCWRRFLGAARFYGAQSLIMGGDLTGKAIVPIAMGPDGRFIGETRSGTTPDQLTDLVEAVRFKATPLGRSSMRCNRCSRSTATSTSLAAALASGARSRSTPALSMGPVACMGSACGSQMTVWFHTSFLSDSTGRST
jgi:hypothetical protein